MQNLFLRKKNYAKTENVSSDWKEHCTHKIISITHQPLNMHKSVINFIIEMKS